MKFRVITAVIGSIIITAIGAGLFIYKMPYPVSVYLHSLRYGPVVDSGIQSSDLKEMWGALKGKRTFYELPIEVKYEDVEGEIVSIMTLLEHNGYDGSGRSYRFTFKNGAWVLDSSIGDWVN